MSGGRFALAISRRFTVSAEQLMNNGLAIKVPTTSSETELRSAEACSETSTTHYCLNPEFDQK
jgi:hypothetical protein